MVIDVWFSLETKDSQNVYNHPFSAPSFKIPGITGSVRNQLLGVLSSSLLALIWGALYWEVQEIMLDELLHNL